MCVQRNRKKKLLSNWPGFLVISFFRQINTVCKHFGHDHSNRRQTCLVFQEISRYIQTCTAFDNC